MTERFEVTVSQAINFGGRLVETIGAGAVLAWVLFPPAELTGPLPIGLVAAVSLVFGGVVIRLAGALLWLSNRAGQ